MDSAESEPPLRARIGSVPEMIFVGNDLRRAANLFAHARAGLHSTARHA
jgi:hypothetical protein